MGWNDLFWVTGVEEQAVGVGGWAQNKGARACPRKTPMCYEVLLPASLVR